MTRVELLENTRTIIGLYVVDVLEHGDEPFADIVRFNLFTLKSDAVMRLCGDNPDRVDARFFNMGETALWLGFIADDVAKRIGLPLGPVPKKAVVEGKRPPFGGSLALQSPAPGAVYAYGPHGGDLLVLERIAP